ncbi:HugZ family protein [Sinimarinibacterium flocculans]|uniref:Uncharacterized protein n=1 Tax=Sinimarinibacterium flocculans TaxID=985250 RepID=A0A318ECJ7_9GAMM|nr:DUF2470 domain-containing protein [Sinimarinibacterium flocculans]PXV67197.1 hypothetical protein C8D93_106174 [Sinimarinibacterium flocculans]
MSNRTADAAHALYAASHQGILSTLSLELAGYPFGSVVSFAPDRAGLPVLLISSIAEHTRNLQADPRCSLIVTEPGDDGQALGRLTLVGDAEPVTTDGENVAARYYARFPQAADYHRTHDFAFWRLRPRKLRYIGGFGRIHWLDTTTVCRANPFDPAQEARMVAHMNADHADAMRDYCRLYGIDPGSARPRMSAIDADGCDLMLDKHLLRIGFEAPATTPDAVRKALVDLARRARAARSPA